MTSGGGRRLRWKELDSWDEWDGSERMLPSVHALVLCANSAISIAPGITASSITGDQCRQLTASAISAPLFRSSVMEITGNKRNAIRHASATATTIFCPRDLDKLLLETVHSRTSAAEMTNHTILSATSKWLPYHLLRRCTPPCADVPAQSCCPHAEPSSQS